MLSKPLANRMAARGLHYGWLVAAVTFFTALSSSAALGLPGALLQPLSREFGWSVDEISAALAVRFALFGLLGPFAAIVLERFGLRRVMATAMLLIAATLGLVRHVTAFWQLVLLLGVALGLGSGMTALVLNAVVANRWFEQRRGLVMGLLTASTATGQLVFLPVGTWLIEHAGWRAALLPVMAVCVLVALAAMLVVRDHPQELGLAPYGAQSPAPVTVPPRVKVSPFTPFKVLAGVRGDRVFWALCASFFICGLSTNGLVQTHFISLCGDAGMGPVPAASVLAMMGVFDLVGTILSGWIFAGHQLGAAVAAYGAGRIRTMTLSYDPAVYVAAGACLVAALLVLAGRRAVSTPAPVASEEGASAA